MDNNVNLQKLKIVFEDKEFVKKLMMLETAEDVKKELEAKGVSLTLDEIEDLGEQIIGIASGVKKEDLSNEELEAVCGGNDSTERIVKGVIGGLAATAVIAIGTKFAYDVYNRYNEIDQNTGNDLTNLGHFIRQKGQDFKNKNISDKRNLWKKGVDKTADFLVDISK